MDVIPPPAPPTITNEKKIKEKSITPNQTAVSVAVELTNNIVNNATSCKKEKKKPRKKNKLKLIKSENSNDTNSCNCLQQLQQNEPKDEEMITETKTIRKNCSLTLNVLDANAKCCNNENECRTYTQSAVDSIQNCANYDDDASNRINGDDKDEHFNVNKLCNGSTKHEVCSEEEINVNQIEWHEQQHQSIITTPNEQQLLCTKLSATSITDDSKIVETLNDNSSISNNHVESSTNHNNSQETAASAIIDTNDLRSKIVIDYKEYENELQMPDIMRLIQKDLSEPYSIYTYRYFIHKWPKLCFLAMHGDICVGAIVCKLDIHRSVIKRGYIAMLAVDQDYRKLKIGTNLVRKAIEAMLVYSADEVVLETELTNTPALKLYENLGFVRDKRLFGYYLNGVDALRLKLWFT